MFLIVSLAGLPEKDILLRVALILNVMLTLDLISRICIHYRPIATKCAKLKRFQREIRPALL